jgi:hypothetical protein
MRRLLVALVLLSACSRHGATIPHYPDGAAGLKALWTDILHAAQKDDRERVHDLMASTLLTDAEVGRLLGAHAAALLPRYHQMMGTLVNRGALDLVGQVYEHKLDAIDVVPDDTEQHLGAILVAPHPCWSARVRKATDKLGLRYDGYLYLDGRWRSVNQLDKFIEPAK